MCVNPIALGKAKNVYNFGLSECSRIKYIGDLVYVRSRHSLLHTHIKALYSCTVFSLISE